MNYVLRESNETHCEEFISQNINVWKSLNVQSNPDDILCKIRNCPPFSRYAHNILYTLVKNNELSIRGFLLTSEIILNYNSSNYTAWWYRRQCLNWVWNNSAVEDTICSTSSKTDELNTIRFWCQKWPKNYQAWFHRRWVIDSLMKRQQTEKECVVISSSSKNIFDIQQELASVEESLLEDQKNMNLWAHRRYLVRSYAEVLYGENNQKQPWHEKEFQFADRMILKDFRNNSAWVFRRNTLQKAFEYWEGLSCLEACQQLIQSEINYCVKWCLKDPNNEATWNILHSFFVDQSTLLTTPQKSDTVEAKNEKWFPLNWNDHRYSLQISEFINSILQNSAVPNRFAIYVKGLIDLSIHDWKGALKNFETLGIIDPIRKYYWDHCTVILDDLIKTSTH